MIRFFCSLLLSVFFLLGSAQHARAVETDASSGVRTYPAFGLSSDQAALVRGRKVYQTYCVGCHGVNGDGQGPAASFLNPKPRNFQDAQFRFRSTPSGDLPTDEDLYRTINEGLRGSSMPSWKFVPEDDKWAVIAYLKSFAPKKWKDGHGPETVIAEDPFGPSMKAAAIRQGEKAYHGMAMCYSCHAAYIPPAKINEARASYGMPPLKGFRENLGKPKPLVTEEGFPIVPPDFMWDRLKRGTDLKTLYHVVGNGVTGTPMPTWKGILPEEDLWGIVYYIQSLTEKRRSLVTEEDVQIHDAGIHAIEQSRIQYDAEIKQAEEAEKVKKMTEEKLAAQAAENSTQTAGVGASESPKE